MAKDGKNYEAVKTKNDLAYAELLICCENDICFSIVENCITDEHPEGDCALAWRSLVGRFEPKTKFNLIQLKKELMESKLEDMEKDPEEWVIELEILCRKIKNLGQNVSEEDLILIILQNLPKEYENTVEILENELENEDLDLNKIKERLKNKYNKWMKNEKSQLKDQAMMAKTGGNYRYEKQYKKQCYT